MAEEFKPCTYEESLEIQNLLRQGIYEDSKKIQEIYECKDLKEKEKIEQLNKRLEKLKDKEKELKKEESYLGFPEKKKEKDNLKLPFFAYGIFKPGQLAYSRIEDYVLGEPKECIVKHGIYERDGIPFVCKDDNQGETIGYIIHFKEDERELAYDIIRKTESKKYYRWETTNCYEKTNRGETDKKDYEEANILFGKKPSKSNPKPVEYGKYDGNNDIFFDYGVRLITGDMINYKKNNSFNNFFRLQRNYLLLWTCIERYTSLKYGENTKHYNNQQLAGEQIFQDSFDHYVTEEREITNSQSLEKEKLRPGKYFKSIDYYYTMRSNVAHRGKSLSFVDERNLRKSLIELLNIFQCVLEDTFKGMHFTRVDIDIGDEEDAGKERFELIGNRIYDYVMADFYVPDSIDDMKNLVDLLNELQDEKS